MVDKVYQALGRQPPPKDRLDIGFERVFPSQITSEISQLSLIGELSNSNACVINSSSSPVIDNSATQYHGFDKEQGVFFSQTIDGTTPSSRFTMPPDLDIGMQADPFESMLNLPSDFDWELFDTKIWPQLSTVRDAWPDLHTYLEN
jgi:hypothetical protein